MLCLGIPGPAVKFARSFRKESMQEKDARKFPGDVWRDPHTRVITLTKEQEEWFKECYPFAPNEWIAKEMRVSAAWVTLRGRALGLEKAYKRGEIFRRWYGEERYKNMHKLSIEKRSRTLRAEVLRVMSGMKKTTNRYVITKRFSCSQVKVRRKALEYGYWYYKNADDTTGLRWNVYYNADTNRSEEIEEKLKAAGFRVLEEEL